MSEPRTCPQCGSPLTADAPDGLCPKCLLAMGFESRAEPPTDDPALSPTAYQPSFLPPSVEQLAAKFPQLELLERIGQGGMGIVYKARQKDLDRIVALKVLRPEIENAPAFAERFVREARALAKLSHPAIVTVHDFGRIDGFYYFIMEYVEGANLRTLERSGKLQPQQALAIVPQICEALQYAHDQGVVHRDIKPENILLDPQGRVKIADFGLAKMAGAVPDETALTGAWQVMGTPQYMAPEQMKGAPSVDHRADIYSLGVVIYEMLTGELPVGRFPLPSQKVQVDVRLDQVVLKTLEREPERRYQKASEVKTEFDTICGDSGQAGDENQPLDLARCRLRGPAIGLMLTGLLALAYAGFVLWVGGERFFRDVIVGGRLNDYLSAPFKYREDSLVLFVVVSVGLLGGVLLRGGWQMLSLGRFRPALLAAWLGQPMGIWALIVLSRPEVRNAFREGMENRAGVAGRRPFSVTLLAPVCLLIGLWQLFLAAMSLALPSGAEDELDTMMQARPGLRAWHAVLQTAESWLELPLAYALLAAGVGLLLLRPWGRWLALGWAVGNLFLGLLLLPVMFAGIALMFLQSPLLNPEGEMEPSVLPAAFLGSLVVVALDIVFPIIVLLVLSRPRVKEAFGTRGTAGLGASDASSTESPGPVDQARPALVRCWTYCVERHPGPTRLVLLATYLLAFILFFGMQAKYSNPEGGPPFPEGGPPFTRVEYTIGAPFPWFEWWSERNVGGRMGLVVSPAWLFAALAFAVLHLALRVRPDDTPVSIWERPGTHAVMWVLLGLAGVMRGFVEAALAAEPQPDYTSAFTLIGIWLALLVCSIVWTVRRGRDQSTVPAP